MPSASHGAASSMLPARRFAPLALVSPPSRRAPEPEYLNRPGIISESTRAGSYGTHALRHPLHGSGTASGATWATFGTGCVLLPCYFRATSAAHPRSRSPSRRCTRAGAVRTARIVASASPAAAAPDVAGRLQLPQVVAVIPPCAGCRLFSPPRCATAGKSQALVRCTAGHAARAARLARFAARRRCKASL